MANTLETEDVEDTTVVNLRDFPVDLHTHLKSKAALARVTLREFIIGILSQAVSDKQRDDPRARAS